MVSTSGLNAAAAASKAVAEQKNQDQQKKDDGDSTTKAAPPAPAPAPAAAAAAAAAATAASASSKATNARDGRLYVCGQIGGKTHIQSVPVSDKSIDNMGHVCFPAPVTGVADSSVRFSQVKGEHTLFAALESRPQPGALWVGKPASPRMERVIPGNVVSFAVGQTYVLAALSDGSLLIVGSHHSIDSEGGAALAARPFKVKPPKGVTCVSASENNIAVVCGDEGAVYTIGDDGRGNGHNEQLRVEWKQIQLLPEHMYNKENPPGTPASPAAAAAPAAASAAASSFKAVQVSQGSIHGAAITACGKVFCWGDGISGTLGIGKRISHSPSGKAYGHDFPAAECGGAVSVACTKAQGNPKRVKSAGTYAPGQEGPRTHVVTQSGDLFIAGTTHKGLGANCLYKTLSPEADLLEFYRVGGRALDAKKGSAGCPTGGAEDLARKSGCSKQEIAHHLGMATADDFGAGSNTNYLSEPGMKIKSTSCVHIHSCAVSEDGRCFCWGCGSGGRTGLDAFIKGPNNSKRLMKCYISSPSAVEKLDTKFVVDADACRYYTLFVIDDS